jgi:uncharacterized repeat protein (TIGR04076 family)
MKKVRITVVKKAFDEELVAKHMKPDAAETFTPCSHDIGESFLVDQPVMRPDGLCPWAWHDIESFVRIAAFEGKVEDYQPDNSWVRCCTDAFRPVTFLIEPVEDS